jgi:DNA-directed RNA polymerase specialized sigma24 family protein
MLYSKLILFKKEGSNMKDINNKGLGLNKLVLEYRNTKEDKYFEELWSEVKPFAFKMGEKYINKIGVEDMEEIAMVCLFDCCRYIKENTNVLTYYGKILINRYYDFYHANDKRGNDKLNNEALSLDATRDNNGSQYSIYNPSTEDDIFILEDFYTECKLLEREITIVNLLNIGYKQREIKEKLKMSQGTYNRLIKNIRKKILENYNFGTI